MSNSPNGVIRKLYEKYGCYQVELVQMRRMLEADDLPRVINVYKKRWILHSD